ncbi:MAG TPA: acyltransferase, partial [Kribbellaceae bacterium]
RSTTTRSADGAGLRSANGAGLRSANGAGLRSADGDHGTCHSAAAGTPARARRRYHEVDLLRFVAAAAVVGFHYMFRASVEHPAFAHTGFSDPGGVFRYGYLGVDLFFVISGFVILNSAWNKAPSAFVASRIGRLYPAFWVACTLTALVMAFDPSDRFHVTGGQWLVNLTMTPQLFDVPQVDGVYWTLLVELKFYLLVLVLCRLGLTLNRVLCFALGWLTISIWDALVPLPDLLDELLVPEWSGYFVAGILFALVAREGWRRRYVVVLLATYAWALGVAVDFAGRQTERYGASVSPYVVVGVVSAIFGIFALIASHRLQWRWTARVAVIGGLTYPLYLLHENVGFVLFGLGRGLASRWVVLAGVLAIVVALAWALHVTVEQRFAAPLAGWLRRRWAAYGAVSSRLGATDVVLDDRHSLADAVSRHWSAPGTAPSSSFGRIL